MRISRIIETRTHRIYQRHRMGENTVPKYFAYKFGPKGLKALGIKVPKTPKLGR